MQRRNKSQNCCLIITPLLIVSLFGLIERQLLSDESDDTTKITDPLPWPPALDIPDTAARAVRYKYMPFTDLPSPSCRNSGTCPVSFLFTGANRSFAMNLAEKMIPPVSAKNPSDMDRLVVATEVEINDNKASYEMDYAFNPESASPLYYLQKKCKANSSIPYITEKELTCLEELHLWRNSSSEINKEIYKGNGGNKQNKGGNHFGAALDFSNSNRENFNVTVWSKRIYPTKELGITFKYTRLPRLLNMVSNAYLQELQGSGTQMLFEFIKEVPTISTVVVKVQVANDFLLRLTSYGLLIYPITVLGGLVVYEKEKNLRIMMKMHGLRDTTYWAITYFYSLIISTVFVQFFLIAGRLSGLALFTNNDYILQSVFYFIHVNWLISLAFVIAALVSTVKTAQVITSLYLMLICVLAQLIAARFIESTYFSSKLVTMVEMFPGFALFRGLYEFEKYAAFGRTGGNNIGMRWKNLSDEGNGMKIAMIIMAAEWAFMLLLAYYLDQVVSSGSGTTKSPFFFLPSFRKKPTTFQQSLQRNSSQDFSKDDQSDIAQERQKVEQLMKEGNRCHTAVCDNIKKIYPGRDGNPPKAAVKGLSLALERSECFGMLGPNGAGKTSFISMMIGLTEPTSGTAYIEGLDITTRMDDVYSCMGVCPQFDLLWETLTGREHLYFYGRLKNLSGATLTQAVENALEEVNLLHGGVADKRAGKYSGGMKRRLSVAISLIGNPKIVYLDEPSTGLDPVSRNSLWSVVKRAKQNRAILLTTHSMEEAEALCDRLGVFVDGALRCVGNSKELKARYGGYFIFTMTTTSGNNDAEVEDMVVALCRNAIKTYHLGGTQKFELPKHEIRLADIFQLVENAKNKFPVQAWGLSDTTLEDVFIKVTRQAEARSSDE